MQRCKVDLLAQTTVGALKEEELYHAGGCTQIEQGDSLGLLARVSRRYVTRNLRQLEK